MSADAVRKEPTKDPLWLAAAISNRERTTCSSPTATTIAIRSTKSCRTACVQNYLLPLVDHTLAMLHPNPASFESDEARKAALPRATTS